MEIININTLPTCGLHGCRLHDARYSIYVFDLDPEEVFRRTCNRSMVYVRRKGVDDPNLVIGKDSRDFFDDHLDMALAELQMLFSRFQRAEDITAPDGKIYDTAGDEVEFNPWIKDTETGCYQVSIILNKVNDMTVVAALTPLVVDFLVKFILQEFYGDEDFKAASAKQRIVDNLNYQGQQVKLKTSPF